MKRLDVTSLIGIFVLVIGALLLLQNLGVFVLGWDLIWGLAFAVGGVIFLLVYWRNREQWWALVPGFSLLGIGALIGLEAIVPGGTGSWGGALFLGAISLAFWAIYFLRREFWWALIPAGALLTLAIVAGISGLAQGDLAGSVFFFGLALTFGLIYLLPTPEGRMGWALIPAAILFVLALVVLGAQTSLLGYIGPVVLLGTGLFLILRAIRRR
jgi:hypothetical protein